MKALSLLVVRSGSDGRRCEPMTRPTTGEQLIGIVIPPAVPRRPPPPSPLPTLPSAPRPSVSGVLFDVARLDSSGRLSSRPRAGTGLAARRQLDVDVVEHRVVITASDTGRHTLTARGGLSLPAPARALSGIGPDQRVLVTVFTLMWATRWWGRPDYPAHVDAVFAALRDPGHRFWGGRPIPAAQLAPTWPTSANRC